MDGSLSPGSAALLAAAGWTLVSLLVSLLGWARLAQHYPCEHPFEGRRFWLQSGGFRRGAGYNFTLVVGVGDAGLQLCVLPFLRIGHPPVLVPWSEIQVCEVQAGWVRRVALGFRSVPALQFRITPRLAGRLAAAVPQHWPAARPVARARGV